MQRSAYPGIPPAHSPPLHHPIPQHVSTVPQLRSPPPPSQLNPQQQNSYAYQPQQHQPQGSMGNAYGAPMFGNFINDPTAQVGFQMGKQALNVGTEYVEQNVL